MQRNFLPSASGKAFDFQDKSKTKWQGCFCITYSTAPPTLVTGGDWEQPPSICWDGRNFSRAIPAAGNHCTEQPCPGGWRKAGTSLPEGLGMRCWSCPWRGASLNRGSGSVQHCSNLDQQWSAERFRGAALLGGDVVQSRALGTGRKNHSQGIRNNRATVKGKWAGWGTGSPWWPGIRDSHQISS